MLFPQALRKKLTPLGAAAIASFLPILALILFTPTVHAAGVDDFVITVKTDNPGTSNATSFTIPTTGGGYDYNVDWDNDGNFDDLGVNGNITHDYGVAGTYTIRIEDNVGDGTGFPRIYFQNGGDKEKILTVEQWGTGIWASMGSAFEGAINLQLNAIDAPDLSQVTDMSWMFLNAQSFDQSINNWDVSNVTDMRYMLGNCSSFNQPLNNWNVGNVTDMTAMFANASAFNQPIDTWDVSHVTVFASMFSGTTAFNQPLNNWNVSSATEMEDMFRLAAAFNQPLDNWNTSSVTDMSNMFKSATSFNQSLNSWDVGSVTHMIATFESATSFDQPLNDWDVSQVTDMGYMFAGATTFNQPLDNWNTSSAIYTNYMFSNASAFNQDIDNWDMSNVININGMFYGTSAFDQPLNSWDVSHVTTMQAVFTNSGFNHPLNNWDVSQVTDMSTMFSNADAFNQPLNDWDTSSVTQMWFMFYDTDAFNQPLDQWNTGNVIDMQSMFTATDLFNQPLNNWNTSSVTDMNNMFYFTTAFNQPLNDWDVSNVVDMSGMFYSAAAFNQPLDQWNTGNVTNMNSMFKDADAFDQDLGNWDIGNVTDMAGMFILGSGLSTPNYDATLVGWSAQVVQPALTFDAGTSTYCNSTLERADLINNDGWIINDAGVDCNFLDYGVSGTYPETPANNGIINNTNPLTITLSGDTFDDPDNNNLLTVGAGQQVEIGNVPAGLTAVMTLGNGNTEATLTFSGKAISNNDVNDVSELTFTFNDSAFTNLTAAQIQGSSGPYGDDWWGIDFTEGDTTPSNNQGGGGGGGGGSIIDPITYCYLYNKYCPTAVTPETQITNKDAELKTVPFTDIAGHWAEDIIKKAYLNGMISGKTPTIFAPDENITRAETAKVMVNFSGLPLASSLEKSTFIDIAGHWAQFFIETMRLKGWAEGYVATNEYKPNQFITRGEFTKLALEAFGYDPSIAPSPFGDTKGKWYDGYAKKAFDLGVVEGYKIDNTFRGDQPITRAEAVAITDRLAAL